MAILKWVKDIKWWEALKAQWIALICFIGFLLINYFDRKVAADYNDDNISRVHANARMHFYEIQAHQFEMDSAIMELHPSIDSLTKAKTLLDLRYRKFVALQKSLINIKITGFGDPIPDIEKDSIDNRLKFADSTYSVVKNIGDSLKAKSAQKSLDSMILKSCNKYWDAHNWYEETYNKKFQEMQKESACLSIVFMVLYLIASVGIVYPTVKEYLKKHHH